MPHAYCWRFERHFAATDLPLMTYLYYLLSKYASVDSSLETACDPPNHASDVASYGVSHPTPHPVHIHFSKSNRLELLHQISATQCFYVWWIRHCIGFSLVDHYYSSSSVKRISLGFSWWKLGKLPVKLAETFKDFSVHMTNTPMNISGHHEQM